MILLSRGFALRVQNGTQDRSHSFFQILTPVSPRISQNPYILQPTLYVVPGQGDAMSVIPIHIFPKKFPNQNYFNLFSTCSSKYLENRQSQ